MIAGTLLSQIKSEIRGVEGSNTIICVESLTCDGAPQRPSD